jgi:hypothetical protein
MRILRRARRLASALSLALIAAVGAHATAPPHNPHGYAVKAGTYRCELGKRLEVRTVSGDQRTAVLNWNQRDYTLKAVGARSGAVRYEDPSSGLVWLLISSKSMLLDSRQGQRLADECRI